MIKKILKISAIVLGIIALGLVYYYFFFTQTTKIQGGKTATTPNFFPFGQGGGNTSTTTSEGDQSDVQIGDYLSKLRLISNEPVAGSTFIENNGGVYIRYMEKATGHIFDVATFSTEIKKISNTTMPKIHNTFFTEKGSSAIAQFVTDDDQETIKTLYLKIASTTSGTIISSAIDSVVVSPNQSRIFYIQKTNNGSIGISTLANGGDRKQIWDSKIKSILSQFAGENQIIVTTKPNARVSGHAYLVNAQTASVKTILQNIPGLSTLANYNGTLLLYYTSLNDGRLYSYSLINGTTTVITPKTLPEKCVFDQNNRNIFYCAVSSDSIYGSSLDDWYLGLISFSDDIWRYDITNNTSNLIESLRINAGRSIDAINLHLNSVGSILTFESKTDGSLWSLNVGQ